MTAVEPTQSGSRRFCVLFAVSCGPAPEGVYTAPVWCLIPVPNEYQAFAKFHIKTGMNDDSFVSGDTTRTIRRQNRSAPLLACVLRKLNVASLSLSALQDILYRVIWLEKISELRVRPRTLYGFVYRATGPTSGNRSLMASTKFFCSNAHLITSQGSEDTAGQRSGRIHIAAGRMNWLRSSEFGSLD